MNYFRYFKVTKDTTKRNVFTPEKVRPQRGNLMAILWPSCVGILLIPPHSTTPAQAAKSAAL